MNFVGAQVSYAQSALAGDQQRLFAVLPDLDTPQPSRLRLAIYIIFSLIGFALLSVTGYLGGALVYDYGIGIPLVR